MIYRSSLDWKFLPQFWISIQQETVGGFHGDEDMRA